MQKNFASALKLVLVHEGGYVDHPQDPGGATNKGVTLAVFQRFYGASRTKEELRAITDAQLEHIYKTGYWDKCQCDALPDGVDYVVFDQAVNSGPGQSAKWLQAAVGVAVDGAIGPQTMAAALQRSPAQVINTMCDARLAFLQRLRNGALWQTFGRGWQARVDGVRAAGQQLATGASASAAPMPVAAAPGLMPSVDYEIVRRGSRGAWVEKLQDALGITVDGIFGPGTEAALKAYQQDAGLTDDGVAGRMTYRALGLEPATGVLASTELVPASIFYFVTKGDGVRGDRVKLGAEFDLIFKYGIPTTQPIATVHGRKLDEVAYAEKAELDIIVIPRGFTLKDSKWVQRATFVHGAIDKEVVFHLQASDVLVADSNVNVIFERNGAILYEFRIPLRLTAAISASEGETKFSMLDFDLDEVAEAANRQPRAARLHIFADGDRLSINFDNLKDQAFQVMPKKLTRSSLAEILGEIQEYLKPVSNHTIWTVLDGPLVKPAAGSNAEKAFSECLERVATAGWILYKKLAADEEVKKVLQAIDNLESGSILSIRTDCAFLPWEIFNASDFHFKYNEETKQRNPVQPQNFWGNKLSIECLLAGQNQTYKTPANVHRLSPAYVSLNIFRTIDNDFQGKPFLPGKSHEALCTELAPGVKTAIQKKGSDIRRIFDTKNYEATLIYLFCHGQNDQALNPHHREKLQIDETDFVSPDEVPVSVKYPRGPIVFLNSCSSGAFSPLSFSTFLSTFREKQALGLIATTFPVPITFGSAFGQALMRRYLKNHQPIGQALLELRREQLANGNPLGLFYSLQCPTDITARSN